VIEDVAGEYRHEGVVETNSFTVPDDAPLPGNSRVRAYLYSIPADLGPPQGHSVNFRTGGMTDVVRHRLKAAPLVSRLLAGMGLLTMLGWAVMERRGS
jgi:hypothetical protein